MIYDTDSARKLIGCLFKNPQLINNEKINLSKSDFEPQEWHMRMFQSIVYLAKHGSKSITAIDLYSTADKYPKVKELFEVNNTKEFVDVITKLANLDNVSVYYEAVKKCSILRAYRTTGFNIEKFENNLEEYNIKDIIDWYKGLQLSIEKQFYKDDKIVEMKAGDGMEQVVDDMCKEPMFGATTFSEYLNTVCRGSIRGQIMCISCTSGAGKTTLGLSTIAKIGAKELYNESKCCYESNPCYQKDSGCLFVQYELDSKTELMPKLLATISGVPTYHILNGKYIGDERERVDYAIKVLHDSNIYTVLMPSFTSEMLRTYITEYALTKNVKYVCFDYIDEQSDVSTEIAKKRNTTTRGDQVVKDLTATLKQIARETNTFILTFTQTNGMENQNEILDSRCIASSKAVQNALDVGIVMSSLRQKEQEVCDMIMEQGNNGKIRPNRIAHIYKCRFTGEEQGLKIWFYLDLNTGRIKDMWVTTKYDQPYSIQKTKLICE